MPFAEWLYRMSEAKVPYQARSLAVYAVLFKVTENEELAVLSGMDTKGNADKTYNKWKKHLSDNGWVRISAETVGRKTTITVIPAIDTTPVAFTDVKSRDVRKFYENKNYERTVISTDDDERSDVETTTERPSPVEVTQPSCAPAPARIESPSGINNTLENNNNPPFTPHRELSFENGELRLFNGMREHWLTEFGDEKLLDLALLQAAPYIQENSRRTLKVQVNAQLARKVADKREKDARYAKTAKTNRKTASGSSPEEHAAMLKAQNEALRKEFAFDKETTNG